MRCLHNSTGDQGGHLRREGRGITEELPDAAVDLTLGRGVDTFAQPKAILGTRVGVILRRLRLKGLGDLLLQTVQRGRIGRNSERVEVGEETLLLERCLFFPLPVGHKFQVLSPHARAQGSTPGPVPSDRTPSKQLERPIDLTIPQVHVSRQ